MTFAFLGLGVFGLLAWRYARRRHRRQLLAMPLAGYDTGVRSPWRTPRRVRFHRGL